MTLDKDGDGQVSLDEVADYVAEKANLVADQAPVFVPESTLLKMYYFITQKRGEFEEGRLHREPDFICDGGLDDAELRLRQDPCYPAPANSLF